MNGPDCPNHPGTSMHWLATFNEWKYYCPLCDERFNDKLKPKGPSVDAELTARANDITRRLDTKLP